MNTNKALTEIIKKFPGGIDDPETFEDYLFMYAADIVKTSTPSAANNEKEFVYLTEQTAAGLKHDYLKLQKEVLTETFHIEKEDRRAVEVLQECIKLMRDKGKDYNNLPQARYYENNGLNDIYCMMHHKMLRIKSVMNSDKQNFESLQDSCRDLINYTSFFVEYLENKMDGQ